MRASWNGMLCVGAVHMPVKLYSATRSNELRFHYLHKQDGGRIKNERVCGKCGQTVESEDLVRGYEVEKGTYVTLTDEDFEKVDVDGAHGARYEREQRSSCMKLLWSDLACPSVIVGLI